jgi:acyl-ACP thioesterase
MMSKLATCIDLDVSLHVNNSHFVRVVVLILKDLEW